MDKVSQVWMKVSHENDFVFAKYFYEKVTLLCRENKENHSHFHRCCNLGLHLGLKISVTLQENSE